MAETSDPIYHPGDIDPLRERLYGCWDRYLDRLICEAEDERPARWSRDLSSIEAYLASVEPNRHRFLQMVGGWPQERCELNARREELAQTDRYRLERVFLTVLPGVETDCLLLTPPGDGQRPAVLAQHGLSGTPEEVCGFVDTPHQALYNRLGIRLVEEGYVVIAPHMAGGFGTPQWGAPYAGGEPQQAWNRARAQLSRKSRLVGREIQGLEMLALSRAVDYLQSLDAVDPDRIGMYGLSQGGQSALWLPALDQRIRASVCAAFFNDRKIKQVGPSEHISIYLYTEEEDKIYTGQLLEFADSDIASLICPRAFFVEAGKQDKAVWWKDAAREFAKLKAIYERLGIGDRAGICIHEGGHECRMVESFAFLAQHLKA